jgi:hypothetical protein
MHRPAKARRVHGGGLSLDCRQARNVTATPSSQSTRPGTHTYLPTCRPTRCPPSGVPVLLGRAGRKGRAVRALLRWHRQPVRRRLALLRHSGRHHDRPRDQIRGRLPGRHPATPTRSPGQPRCVPVSYPGVSNTAWAARLGLAARGRGVRAAEPDGAAIMIEGAPAWPVFGCLAGLGSVSCSTCPRGRLMFGLTTIGWLSFPMWQLLPSSGLISLNLSRWVHETSPKFVS